MSAAGFSASSSAARGLFQYGTSAKKEKYHLHHGKKVPFQFSSLGSSTSHPARPHLAHQGSSSVSSTHSISSLSSSLRRPAQATHFYIPGEVEGPYPVAAFPTVKPCRSSDTVDEDKSKATSENAQDGANEQVNKSCSGNQQRSMSGRFAIVTNGTAKVWSLITAAFKKEAKLSEIDIFNEACALRLAAQFGASRIRGKRELDHLTKSTQFSRSELKLLYWGWKCSCPSGTLNESTFKEIYAQFFPQAGDSSHYAHHVYRAMFGQDTSQVTFTEYALALSSLTFGTLEDKLSWTFKLYDIDGDGKLTLNEIQEIARAIYNLLGYYVTPPYDKVTSDQHAARIFTKLDRSRKGFLLKDEFVDICSRDEKISHSLKILNTGFIQSPCQQGWSCGPQDEASSSGR